MAHLVKKKKRKKKMAAAKEVSADAALHSHMERGPRNTEHTASSGTAAMHWTVMHGLKAAKHWKQISRWGSQVRLMRSNAVPPITFQFSPPPPANSFYGLYVLMGV